MAKTVRRSGKPDTAGFPVFVLSRKVMTLANLLKRGAGARYRRLLDLPQGEWGVIAQLGEREPRTLSDLAGGMGLDVAQISRSVTNLVAGKLVTRVTNPLNNREVLIALSEKGREANDVIVSAGSRVNAVLLEGLSNSERTILAQQLEQFTKIADRILADEQTHLPETTGKRDKPAKVSSRRSS